MGNEYRLRETRDFSQTLFITYYQEVYKNHGRACEAQSS